MRAEIDRAYALLLSEPQIVVAWAAAADEPQILGDTSLITPAATPHRVLAFGTWLGAEEAGAMEHAVDALRARGEGFCMTLASLSGRPIEAEGRAIGGSAVLRLRDVSGLRRELAELSAHHRKMLDDVDSLRALIETLPAPVWARDGGGAAGVRQSGLCARRRGEECRRRGRARRSNFSIIRAARIWRGRARRAARIAAGCPPSIAGARRTLDVIEIPTRRGAAGIGIDATEADIMRIAIERLADAHRRTLDQLATGVAIFGADQKLNFYNAAYRALWDLDAGFLDQAPADSAVLDRLRAARKLPEEQDYQPVEEGAARRLPGAGGEGAVWHLPDGRTLRVVTTPNPQGGVTYLFDNVTERLDLERRFDALIRVQGETLDNLAEGVAVFASDGRIRLYNPVFARMWRLAATALPSARISRP